MTGARPASWKSRPEPMWCTRIETMPARTLPQSPTFTTTSEQEVWEHLRGNLSEDDVLLASVRLTDEAKDHEIDLIVLMPDVGIVVLEVKGGSVWYDEQGWHRSAPGGRTKTIHPVDQARGGKYAVREYVERDLRWRTTSRSRVVWAHGVVTPYSSFDADFEAPDCPRWALHDRADMTDLVERLRVSAGKQQRHYAPPTREDIDLIVEILQGRRHTTYDVNAESEERAAEAERLTSEQAIMLQVTRLLNRVEVRGGAGSGKTILALTQARELTRGRQDRPAQRVALLCYSIGLAEHFKREVASWHRKHRPAFVGTFHELGRSWGAPEGDRSDSEFWETHLPATMAELAEELLDKQRFDAVIVDEAQDFADSWWRPLLKALRDEETGGLYVYSDENQRIFARFGRPPVPLVPLVLDHNLRNTRQIHEAFGPLAPSRMYARGGDGPAVRFVSTSPEDALDTADDEVIALLDAGWKPENVALLTTGHRHPVQLERTAGDDQQAYWRTFWENDDVFYGHVLGCKGLERRAVVLCVNDAQVRERARERLYVGMSRATDELVVVGDPEVVREMGGDAVAKQLGI